MKYCFLVFTIMLLNVSAVCQTDEQKIATKVSGHDFVFKAAPEQCYSVSYKEVATGVTKDAGGATPSTVRLAPKLYQFTCKCPSGDVVSAPTMVAQAQSYTFVCKAAAPELSVKEQPGSCKINRDDANNVDDHKRIGDQELFHIRCPAPGNVTTAKYDGCNWAGGEVCSHINARNEMSGPCADNHMIACIYYQTNDGNFKVISGSFTYVAEVPPKITK